MPRKAKDIQYYESVGRRRESVARVRLYIVGKDKTAMVKGEKEKEKMKVKAGEIMVNGIEYGKKFNSLHERAALLAPLKLTGTADRFAISIHIEGGGRKGQLEASVHGLSRALNSADMDEFRPLLKKNGFLRRDPRIRERRKVGTGGKARRQKQSPKR